ncbi:hypothetical protein EDB89DRAFT_1903574 [Lactarius sanguifluus]|nr:hypothetical protein EDB89DRAFT_1903574 [Lactarius sanguifluus]
MNEKLAFGRQSRHIFRSYLKASSIMLSAKECQAVGLGDGRYRAISEMSRREQTKTGFPTGEYDVITTIWGPGATREMVSVVQGNDGDGGWEYGIITPRRRKLRDKEGKETCALRRNRNFLSPALLEVLQVLKHVYKQGRLNCMV